MEGFHCIATNELLPRRLDIQRINGKCEFPSGYILGDITLPETKQRIYTEIDRWADNGNDRVDVVLATPPCQGISVINHKKNGQEIKRNSLVVESVEIIHRIHPRIFIFENVMAFQKTLCITHEEKIMPIGDFIREMLGESYTITGRILNFMNYGSNSSRTRTLVIGVDKAYRNNLVPYDLFPDFVEEKTLRDVIYDYPRLDWDEICPTDFYHAFRVYDPKMRSWIHDLREGESAFGNPDPLMRPHKIKDGEIVPNIEKTRDKYTRQYWDRFVQCIHTRNDLLAAQNTLHPEDDRVLSIRELMDCMTIPPTFKWIDATPDELNSLSEAEKRKLYKRHEVNIRQCIGEAVPTNVIRCIAQKIKTAWQERQSDPTEINKIISAYHLSERQNLLDFLQENPLGLDLASLIRITELCNAYRETNAAFYTNKFIVNEIMGGLPTFGKDEIRILEPSVGAGSFIPFLFKRYESVPHVILDLVDIDERSIETLRIILGKIGIPNNFTVNFICHDFVTWKIHGRYDLAVGNPPFSKIKVDSEEIAKALKENVNRKTLNLAAIFLEKCLRHSDCVALMLNKNILSSEEYLDTRDLLRTKKIETIFDFGRYGFTGVSIETICMVIDSHCKPKHTTVYNMKYNTQYRQEQAYITDKSYPTYLLYRNELFDRVASKLELNVFSVFRDRQITKSNTHETGGEGSLWVIKAKNIDDDGMGVSHIDGYDAYIEKSAAEKFSAYKYVNDDSVYLTPNMTYNPRVIENIPDTIADGSVAVLIPKRPLRMTTLQRAYFSSKEYRAFYAIARNFSTQSINVDHTSVYYYGVLKDE